MVFYSFPCNTYSHKWLVIRQHSPKPMATRPAPRPLRGAQVLLIADLSPLLLSCPKVGRMTMEYVANPRKFPLKYVANPYEITLNPYENP